MKVSQSAVSFTHRYPHCLHMLELLQYEHFRKELVNAQCAKFIDEQQILHWQHYSRKRTRLQQALAEQQQQQQQTAPHGNNTATKWSPSWYTPASEAYSMCTIPQVTVSRNECKYCTIPRVVTLKVGLLSFVIRNIRLEHTDNFIHLVFFQWKVNNVMYKRLTFLIVTTTSWDYSVPAWYS